MYRQPDPGHGSEVLDDSRCSYPNRNACRCCTIQPHESKGLFVNPYRPIYEILASRPRGVRKNPSVKPRHRLSPEHRSTVVCGIDLVVVSDFTGPTGLRFGGEQRLDDVD